MVYKAFAVTHMGAEDLCADEIKERISAKNIKTEDNVVLFDIDELLDLCNLCYTAQSVHKIVLMLGQVNIFPELEKTIEELKKIQFDLDIWSDKNTVAMVDCERIGKHEFKSVDVAAALSGIIRQRSGEKIELSFKSPNLVFFLYIYKNKGYFGIDFSVKDLAKRDYKIFQTKTSIKGTLAYLAIRYSGYDGKGNLLDCFSKEGIMAIEAALYAKNFPVNFYSKDRFMFKNFKPLLDEDIEVFLKRLDSKIKKAKPKIFSLNSQLKLMRIAQKNAKIGGIFDSIVFSAKSIEWMDTKFDEKTIDYVVTYIPESGRNNPEAASKLYEELFYQFEYVLKKTGKVVFIALTTDLLEKAAKKHKFKISGNKRIYSGKQEFILIRFERGI
ncbi:MAG: hypothetical protein KKF44_06025 [Nanoarchaeota archaeon]|nr:hypothetical protein [Nanoarchaeota archaeon]